MIQVALLAIVGVLLALTLKKTAPLYSMLVSIAVSLCIIWYVMGRISILLTTVKKIKELADFPDAYFRIVLKMIGITYLAEFASGFCKDAGFSNIATQISLFAKVAILLLALPAVEAFLNFVVTVVV